MDPKSEKMLAELEGATFLTAEDPPWWREFVAERFTEAEALGQIARNRALWGAKHEAEAEPPPVAPRKVEE